MLSEEIDIPWPPTDRPASRPANQHPPHPTNATKFPSRRGCLVPGGAGLAAVERRDRRAPPLGQLFQSPSPPWASHSLIQGSFVVLTSWNSWAAQLQMLLKWWEKGVVVVVVEGLGGRREVGVKEGWGAKGGDKEREEREGGRKKTENESGFMCALACYAQSPPPLTPSPHIPPPRAPLLPSGLESLYCTSTRGPFAWMFLLFFVVFLVTF